MEGKEVVGGPGVLAGLFATFLCITLPLEAHPAPESGSARFLVVERPDRLLALNGYQQNLSPQDQLLFQPFAPMRILRDRDLLGDGFTPCMRVEIEGALYFLIRDTNGHLAGDQRAGTLRTVSGTQLRRDTVHVLEGGVLLLASPDGQREQSLKIGERLIRLFVSEGKTYVKCPGRSPAYGWVTFSPAAEEKQWGLAHVVYTAESMIPARVRDSVQAALVRTNAILSSLYRFFNEQAGENRPAPHWHLEVSQVSLLCTLVDASPERDFPEGTRYLIKDLQNFLLGTDFGVFQSTDGIEIRPK
jgi:hypothetical protein